MAQTSDFDFAVNANQQGTDFDGAVLPTINQSGAAPNTTTLLASLATSDEDVSQAGLNPEHIEATRQKLSAGEEYNIRLRTAAARQQRQAAAVKGNLGAVLSKNTAVTPETQKYVDDTYSSVINERVEDNARSSVEREAVDKIHDDFAAKDPVEAKLTYELMFGRGNATKVWYDDAAKNMMLAQKIEQLEGEASDQSWTKEIVNGLIGLIPFNSNFAQMGTVNSEGTGGLKNFLLSGSSRNAQAQAFASQYVSPEDFSDSLKNGGAVDQAMRANSTTLGFYDPRVGTDIIKGLGYESDSDRRWANAWSLFDPVTVALPWAAKGMRIPGMLQRLGSRTAARSALAGSIEDIIANGAEKAAARHGISEAEAIEGLEVSGMHARGTPNDVPLAVDVQGELDKVAAIRAEMPSLNPPSSLTNSDELVEAVQAKIKQIEKETGRPIKDVKYYHKDVATGERTERALLDPLPENGNVVFQVDVTWGRKGGGGYAKARTAVSEMLNKLGIRATAEGTELATERTVANAEMGFKTRAYHGTASTFDNFDAAKAGSATGAENTKGVTFFSDEPAVAGSYAKHAAGTVNEKELAEAKAAFHADPSDANADRYENAINGLVDDAGANVRPHDIDTTGFVEHDMNGRAYNGPETQAIIDHARSQGAPGVTLRNYEDDILGGKPSTIFAVFDNAKVKSQFDVNVVRDVSGQWFGKATFDVPLDGFRTTELATQKNGLLAGLRSDARRVDDVAQAKAVGASSSANRLRDAIGKRIKESRKGLSKQDHVNLEEILRKGNNSEKWFNDSEISILYERLAGEGKVPSEKFVNAYHEYRFANDLDFSWRREQLYKQRVEAGYENVKLKKGYNFDGNAKVSVGGNRPSERVFNATDGVAYNSRNPLTADEFNRLSGEGYLLIESEEALEAGGTHFRKILAHRSEVERSPLELEKSLGYRAGGHRAYTGRYYIKSALGGTQADTGSAFLKNPAVWRTGNNPNRLRDWAHIFNKAIDDAERGIRDPQHFDDNIFANTQGLSFPSGEDFLKAVEDGRVDLKHRAEVVGDRELPSIYRQSGEDVSKFIDEEVDSAGGYYRTNGKMYTSAKGDALLDETGEFAETVDPWETIDRSLGSISRMTSMSGYKSNIVERFQSTYGHELVDNSGQLAALTSKVKEGVPPALARQIKAEQAAAARIMGFKTSWDRGVDSATRELAEWVIGDARGGARENVANAIYWLKQNNPVNYIRGLAFDAKLGLFNPGQFLLQSFTMVASAALSPTHGWNGFKGMPFAFALSATKGPMFESTLDVFAKRGAWKIAGFESEQEFKDFHRFVHRSGFLDVDGSMTAINSFGPDRIFGSGGKFEAAREAGRIMFYKAEVANRSVASRIAWNISKEKGHVPGTSEFRDSFASLADDYSLNMTHESRAAFQTGLMSIPTQFWAYNVRMMDAMLGNGFSGVAKARLITSQLALYGMAGVPLGAVAAEWMKKSGGEPIETGSVASYIDRGMFDNAIAAVTGADIRIGERVGTGSFLNQIIKDLFGQSEYGEKSFADIAGGATYSIAKDTFKTLGSAAQYAAAESGGDQGFAVTRDAVLKLAANISTIGNAQKAMLVANYGYLKSNKGTIQASDIPKEDAFFVALGLGTPQELDNSSLMKSYNDNIDEQVKEASGVVKSLRQEAFLNPDKYQTNMEQINLFMRLQPAFVRRKILRQSNRSMDASFYDHIEKKYNKERMEMESLNGQSDSNP